MATETKMTVCTLMGYTMGEAIAKLDEALEPAAYKAVPGAVDLTDIKPAWLTAYLNQVFGIAGFGWWFSWDRNDLVVTPYESKGRQLYAATLDRLEFYFRLLVGDQLIVAGPVLANGGSDNSEREYAVRGAITNALGGAASKLGWQLSVYQDKRGHAGKVTGKPASKPAPAPAPQPASAKPNGGHGNGAHPAPAQPAAVADPLDETRNLVLPAGKHKGETLGEVYQTDPEYVQWLADNAKTPAIQQAAAALLPAQSAPADPAPAPDPQPASAPAQPAPQPAVPAPAPAPSAPPVKPAAMTLETARATTLPFAPRGKEQFKGKPLGEVYTQDPEFVRWLAANAVSASIKTAASVIAAATGQTATTA